MTTTAAPTDLPVQATVKLPESLWRRVKIEAIREGVTVSEYVHRTLEATLSGPASMPRARAKKSTGEKGGTE